ncbi:MAG: hypothetical protein NTX25_19730, partial [Proteobacteria bacterium]|nr:hypothetical protein [Pseudomonadota bacterium]
PEETQLKIQTQVLAKGISISVAQGGILVQAKEPMSSSKKKPQLALKAKAEAPPPVSSLEVQTAQYSIDLSKLSGVFRLLPNTPIASTEPENVNILGQNRNIKLANLQQDQILHAGEESAQNIIEVSSSILTEELPLAEPAHDVAEIKDKSQKNLLLKPAFPEYDLELKSSSRKPNFKIPEPENLQYPELSASELDFFWGGAVAEALELPLILSATDSRTSTDPWQPTFRIRVANDSKYIFIRRHVERGQVFFSLAEISKILPEEDLDHLILTIEPGLFRTSKEGKQTRTSGKISTIRLHSLLHEEALTLKLDRWSYRAPDDQWFSMYKQEDPKLSLHIFEKNLLKELEGFLKGARSIALEDLSAEADECRIHFVREEKIILCLVDSDAKIENALSKKLQPDLIFRGSPKAFLGGKESFDIEHKFDLYPQVFYSRGRKIMAMDKNLFTTQPIARKFILSLEPYFFKESVDILYIKE